jgi:hypothetical protein
MHFIEKYGINIITEELLEWKNNDINIVNIDKLDTIYIIQNEIKIIFPLGYNNLLSEPILFQNNKGYFTDRDIIKIIFNYYNGLLSDNEIYNLKKNKYFSNCETRKDILIETNICYIDDFILEKHIYTLYLGS